MKRAIISAAIILAASGTAGAFNLNADKAVAEPAMTIVEANRQIDAEKAKCPDEFASGGSALAFFHIKKGEHQGSNEVKDDKTVVRGYVCSESVASSGQVVILKVRKARFLTGMFLGLVMGVLILPLYGFIGRLRVAAPETPLQQAEADMEDEIRRNLHKR